MRPNSAWPRFSQPELGSLTRSSVSRLASQHLSKTVLRVPRNFEANGLDSSSPFQLWGITLDPRAFTSETFPQADLCVPHFSHTSGLCPSKL